MTGEAFALLAAIAYGFAGASIAKGREVSQGDNGLFLSVVFTAILSGSLCMMTEAGWPKNPALMPDAIAFFAVAGLLSTALGRATMFYATERIGAVRAGLLRRLAPVFAAPAAFLLLGQAPDAQVWIGGFLLLAGVFVYFGKHPVDAAPLPRHGVSLGLCSAVLYALAYTVRSGGLDILPYPSFGAFVGAVAACLWFVIGAVFRLGVTTGIRGLVGRVGVWHLATAVALSMGQVLQIFALNTASVAVVAALGSLDVFFAAIFSLGFRNREHVFWKRLCLAIPLAIAGTAVLLF